MQLDLQCQKCEESFSLDFGDISSDPEIRCPGCGAKGTEALVEPLIDALEELFASLNTLRRKFSCSVEVDSEDLPAPYDEVPATAKKAALLDEEESEDADEEEEEAEELEEL